MTSSGTRRAGSWFLGRSHSYILGAGYFNLHAPVQPKKVLPPAESLESYPADWKSGRFPAPRRTGRVNIWLLFAPAGPDLSKKKLSSSRLSVGRRKQGFGLRVEEMLLNQASPDLEIVERRRDIRIVVSIPGRYTLADHRNARGERRTFSCRAVNISGHALVLAAPVIGNLGERVIAHIDHLGRLDGAVMRLLSRGFVMSIAGGEDERSRLLDRIEWLEKHKNHDVEEQRATNRFVP